MDTQNLLDPASFPEPRSDPSRNGIGSRLVLIDGVAPNETDNQGADRGESCDDS